MIRRVLNAVLLANPNALLITGFLAGVIVAVLVMGASGMAGFILGWGLRG